MGSLKHWRPSTGKAEGPGIGEDDTRVETGKAGASLGGETGGLLVVEMENPTKDSSAVSSMSSNTEWTSVTRGRGTAEG